MPPSIKSRYLLVEGKDDKIVTQTLLRTHNVAGDFDIEDSLQDESGGIDKLLDGIPIRLKTRGIVALGIVVDADQDLKARWESLLHRLKNAGYQNLPNHPDPLGTILSEQNRPKVGIWLMPDNKANGMLEDFLTYLVPPEDKLLPLADNTLTQIEGSNLNKYAITHRSKALIHTWLAWQAHPGRPFGTALTARILVYNQPIANTFINWLKRLFED